MFDYIDMSKNIFSHCDIYYRKSACFHIFVYDKTVLQKISSTDILTNVCDYVHMVIASRSIARAHHCNTQRRRGRDAATQVRTEHFDLQG